MQTKIENIKPVSVKQLIELLKKQNPDAEIIIKDKDGNRLHNVDICTREDEFIRKQTDITLGCLFG